MVSFGARTGVNSFDSVSWRSGHDWRSGRRTKQFILQVGHLRGGCWSACSSFSQGVVGWLAVKKARDGDLDIPFRPLQKGNGRNRVLIGDRRICLKGFLL